MEGQRWLVWLIRLVVCCFFAWTRAWTSQSPFLWNSNASSRTPSRRSSTSKRGSGRGSGASGSVKSGSASTIQSDLIAHSVMPFPTWWSQLNIVLTSVFTSPGVALGDAKAEERRNTCNLQLILKMNSRWKWHTHKHTKTLNTQCGLAPDCNFQLFFSRTDAKKGDNGNKSNDFLHAGMENDHLNV